MEKIGMILSNVLKKTNIDKKVREADVFLNYDMIVGDKLARSEPANMYKKPDSVYRC